MKTFLVLLVLTVTLLPMKAAPTAVPAQDVTFRLLNLERRCDQLQMRVDQLERQLQNQSMAAMNNPTRDLLVEMQRQQLSLNEQLLILQQQQLEMRKAFDLQTNRLQELEKRAGSENKSSGAKTPGKTAPSKP